MDNAASMWFAKKCFRIFKPFLYARLDKLGLATTISRQRLVEKERGLGLF